MEQKDVNKNYKVKLFWSLALTLGMPIGLAMLLVGLLADSGDFRWVLAAPGIALLAVGFYGCPIIWTNSFATAKRMKSLYHLIEGNDMVSIVSLSQSTGLRTRDILSLVRKLISERYLPNYAINSEFTMVYDKTKLVDPKSNINHGLVGSLATEQKKCTNCGADVTLKNGVGKCDYCGRVTKL